MGDMKESVHTKIDEVEENMSRRIGEIEKNLTPNEGGIHSVSTRSNKKIPPDLSVSLTLLFE